MTIERPWQSPAVPSNPVEVTKPLLEQIEAATPGAIEVTEVGDGLAVRVQAERLLELCAFLKHTERLDFDLLVAETAIDWLDWFDVVYVLRSTSLRHDLAFTVQVRREHPVVPSLAGVWPAAIWLEREAYDLLGVQFAGHPDPRRILTWDEFEGHPLRKDFGLGSTRNYDQVPPGYKKVGEESSAGDLG